MLLDKEQNFSLAQEVKSDCASTNIIQGKGEIAAGTPIPVVVQVVEDFTGLTSLEVQVQTSADGTFASYETLQKTDAIPLAKLKKGYVANIKYLPEGNLGYMRLFYKVVGTGTAGKITAGISAALQQPSNR